MTNPDEIVQVDGLIAMRMHLELFIRRLHNKKSMILCYDTLTRPRRTSTRASH